MFSFWLVGDCLFFFFLMGKGFWVNYVVVNFFCFNRVFICYIGGRMYFGGWRFNIVGSFIFGILFWFSCVGFNVSI